MYIDKYGHAAGGTNGTYIFYPSEGHFIDSIHLNSARMETGWGNLRAIMAYPTDQYAIDRCQALASAGLPKPLTPAELP